MKIASYYRMLFGLIGFSSLITEIAVLTERGTFSPANFFSYFTIQSNIIAVVVLLYGALLAYSGKNSRLFDNVRGAAVLYITTTWVVFSLLLSKLEGQVFTAVAWDNIVLHYLLPVASLVEWIVNPPHRKISFKKALWWLSYPITYLIYTLVRGHITGWYPYPFVNVSENGYLQVFTASAVIVVLAIPGIFLLAKAQK